MHMADALLAPGVAGVMYACSAVAAGRSVRKLNQQPNDKAVPVMGVMGAFVFAAQMINFTIPGTGSSGHLCGGMLLAAIVGPYAAFLTMIGVLLIQCLLFADGGLMALGANIWNMAFYGCFVGGLIWRAFTRKGLNRAKIIAASLIGCILSLQLGAFSVSVETLASGITALPFGAFLLAMQPIHLAIGAVEGCITAAVLAFLYEARPSLLWQGGVAAGEKQRLTLRGTLGVLAGAAVSFAGLLGFVGLIIPHLVRFFVRADNRIVLPLSAVSGAAFVVVCDLLARVLFAPYEVPVGILMAFLGGPFFIYLILKNRRGSLE